MLSAASNRVGDCILCAYVLKIILLANYCYTFRKVLFFTFQWLKDTQVQNSCFQYFMQTNMNHSVKCDIFLCVFRFGEIFTCLRHTSYPMSKNKFCNHQFSVSSVVACTVRQF